MDWVPKESEVKLDKVAIDVETNNMLKARFGEDVVQKLQANLEVKAEVQKKDHKDKGRRGGKDRAPRQPKEKK